MRYGYGWFWQQYDHNHAALVPPSTAYPTPPLDWWHPEWCRVDRTSGLGCTCKFANDKGLPMKVIVYHRGYGCDTGCCGHVIRVQNDDGTKAQENFTFAHPAFETPREFAEAVVKDEFGADHVADLAWEECEIVDD